MDLNTLLLRLCHELRDNFGALGIKQAVSDRHVGEDFFEGVGHSAADDDFVRLIEQVADERNFIGYLRAAEDGKKRAFWMIQNCCKRIELLLHEETGYLVGKRNADDR